MFANVIYATVYAALALALSQNPIVAVLVWIVSFRLETVADLFGVLVRSQYGSATLQQHAMNMAQAEHEATLAQHEINVARVARNN